METREERIGKNEALFRVVNERLEELNEAFATVTRTMTIVCECGDVGCADQLEIPLAEYERIRADPTLFVVTPGHAEPDVEDVVDHGRYDVVRKQPGEPARIATETDPRH
jgi:hypothetical protein